MSNLYFFRRRAMYDTKTLRLWVHGARTAIYFFTMRLL
jgi:hypothetical protein